MPIPPRRHRALIGLPLLVAVAVAGGACSHPHDGVRAEPVVHDLVATLHPDGFEPRLRGVEFRDASDRRYATGGWGYFPLDPAGGGAADTIRARAVLDVPLPQPIPMAVVLDMAPTTATPVRQLVHLFWNDRLLTPAPLALDPERRTYTVPVPEQMQRVGPNRLEIRPLVRVTPPPPTNPDGVALGVRVWRVEFEAEAGAVGAPPPAGAVSDGWALQPPGTVVSRALVLPEEPVLELTAIAEGLDAVPAAAAGGLVVSLLGEDGTAEFEVRRTVTELAQAPRIDLRHRVAAEGGTALALSVAFNAPAPAAGAAAPRLRWQGRVTGHVTRAASAPSRRPATPCNVVVVLFDTMRPDHIGPYDAARPTPAMSRLAASGVTFLNAFSTSSWTRPAIGSLLTGVRPLVHGAETPADGVRADMVSLPAVLQAHGYRTFALSHNGNFAREVGLDRGFDGFVEVFLDPARYLTARAAGPEALAAYYWDVHVAPFLDSAGDQPFLVWLHDIDPHSPYAPPPPYDGGRLLWRQDPAAASGEEARSATAMLELVNSGLMRLEREELETLVALYDGEIAYQDRVLATLLARLAARRTPRNTLVVLVSDHGEEFLGHDRVGHGNSLYDNTLRVPLVLALPGVLPAGRRPAATAQLLDVAPTILDILGVAAPAPWQGRSLVPAIFGPATLRPPDPAFARLVTREGLPTEVESVVQGRWKLHRQSHPDRAAGYELYDLETDPGETRDVWSRHHVRGRALADLLAAQHAADAARTPNRHDTPAVSPLRPATREHLQALGYID